MYNESMVFEEFNSKGGKFVPQISINKSGGFGLSSGMHRRYNLDRYKGVKMYYDQDNKKVGIKLLEEDTVGMFTLKKRDDEKGAFFAPRSFLQAYSIDPKKYYGKYPPEEVEDEQFGKLFVIQLEEKESEQLVGGGD